jgi:C1A family cysteine protease
MGYLTTDDKLSVQQLVSCDDVDLGCLGGNTETAYSYIEDEGGVALSDDYPYTSYFDISGSCKLSSKTELSVTLSKYYTVTDEDDMQDYVLGTGPLSACMAASSWTSYKSGVVSSCDDDVDHCVQITGVDTDSGYWIIRNSWGTSWGNSGYIYLKTGENMCAVTNDPTYTVPEVVSRRRKN